MNRKNLTEKNKSESKKKSGASPIPWKYCLLTLGCGFILVVGFFFAARQHFASIDFSIKNSRLRKQIEELEACKRRLILAKEIALSPAEIKKAAQKIGFREMTAGNIEVVRPNANLIDNQKAEKDLSAKPQPIAPTKTDEVKKPEKQTKPEKTAPPDKAGKDKTDKGRVQIAKK